VLAVVVVCDVFRYSAYLCDLCEGAHVGILADELEWVCVGSGSTRLDGDKLPRGGRCFSWILEHAICSRVQVMSIGDMNKVFGQQRQVVMLAMSSDIVRLLLAVRGQLRKMVAPGNTIRGSERKAGEAMLDLKHGHLQSSF
jgi:hypothetical protein